MKKISFNKEMVTAITNFKKTQTRRTKGLEIINKNPELYRYDGFNEELKYHYFERINDKKEPLEKYTPVKCPYNIGDTVYVQEKFMKDYFGPGTLAYESKWEQGFELLKNNPDMHYEPEWIPANKMPKSVARVFLEIKNIRVERLNEISEKDVIAEGVRMSEKGSVYKTLNEEKKLVDEVHKEDYFYFYPSDGDFRDDSYMPKSIFKNAPMLSFYSLWVSIYNQKSWDKNSFVWVIEFDRISDPDFPF